MKKPILSLGLLVVLLLGVTAFPACGEKKPPEPKPETVTVYGEFYTIKEAYAQGYLTLDNLDYINDNTVNGQNQFTPLEETKKEKISHDYRQTHAIASDQLEISNYGCYQDSTVVWIIDRYYDNIGLWDTSANYWVGRDIYNVEATLPFWFWQVRVWKECEAPIEVEKPPKPNGAFYSPKRACELGFLSEEEIKQITNQPSTKELFRDEIGDKIKEDYRSFGMEGTELFEISYYGVIRACIVLEFSNLQYYNAYEQMRPVLVWCPLSEKI